MDNIYKCPRSIASLVCHIPDNIDDSVVLINQLDGIMAVEATMIKLVSWATAMAIEHVASHFADSLETSMVKWKNQMREMITSAEGKAIDGEECCWILVSNTSVSYTHLTLPTNREV